MSRRKKILIAILVFVILIVGAGTFFIHKLAAPTTGKIVASQPVTSDTAPTFNFNPVEVHGKFIAFAYPMSLTPDTNNLNKGASLENYVYEYADSPESWILAVSVNKLNQPTLKDDSGYNLRIAQPSIYVQSSEKIGEQNFTIFKQNNVAFSQTAFVMNPTGTMSADISLTGDDPTGTNNLQTTFSNVVNSFTWQ